MSEAETPDPEIVSVPDVRDAGEHRVDGTCVALFSEGIKAQPREKPPRIMLMDSFGGSEGGKLQRRPSGKPDYTWGKAKAMEGAKTGARS